MTLCLLNSRLDISRLAKDSNRSRLERRKRPTWFSRSDAAVTRHSIEGDSSSLDCFDKVRVESSAHLPRPPLSFTHALFGLVPLFQHSNQQLDILPLTTTHKERTRAFSSRSVT